MPTRTATPTPEGITCAYDVELDDVLNRFDYWYVNSRPTFVVVLRNTGTCVWPEDTKLVLVSENALDWQESWLVGLTAVDASKEIEIQLTAPGTRQTLHIRWQLETPDGQSIGSPIEYDLRIEPPPSYGGALQLPPALDGESPAQTAGTQTRSLSTVATVLGLAVSVIVRFRGHVQRAWQFVCRLRSRQDDKGLITRPSG
jgi:hypothetical protein